MDYGYSLIAITDDGLYIFEDADHTYVCSGTIRSREITIEEYNHLIYGRKIGGLAFPPLPFKTKEGIEEYAAKGERP